MCGQQLHNDTTGVCLLCLFVEHLGAGRQGLALVNQGVQLLTSFQHTLNGLVQDNFGLVQLLLDPHYGVRLRWILVLLDVVGQLCEFELAIGLGGILPFDWRVFCDVVIYNLVEQRERWSHRVLLVRDEDRTEPF